MKSFEVNQLEQDYEENVLDSQKTVYIKHPKSRKAAIHKSTKRKTIVNKQLSDILANDRKIPFARLLGGKEPKENVVERYNEFEKFWRSSEKRISKVIDEYQQPLMSKILSEIDSSFKPESKPKSAFILNTDFNKKIPTTLLLSGTNIANHVTFFNTFSHKLKSHHHSYKLIALDSKDCHDYKSMLKQISYSLYDFEYAGTVSIELDSIRNYCLEYYKSEGKDISSTKLRIVLLIKNLNSFNQRLLLTILKFMQQNVNVIPFKLILNVASFSTDFLDSSLDIDIKRLISCKSIQVSYDSSTLFDKIADATVFYANQPLLLDTNVLTSILQYHAKNSSTTQAFVTSLKYCMMSHYYSMPMVIFQKSHKKIDLFARDSLDKCASTDGMVEYAKFLSHLPSFRIFIEKILLARENFDSTLKSFLEVSLDISNHDGTSNGKFFMEKLLPFAANQFAKTSQRLLKYLDLLMNIQRSLWSNQDFLKSKNLIFNESKLEKYTKLELYSMVLANDDKFRDLKKTFLSEISNLPPYFLTSLVDYISNEEEFYGIIPSDLLSEFGQFQKGGQYYVDIYREDYSGDGFKEIPVQGKIRFENLVEKFIRCLNESFFVDELLQQKQSKQVGENGASNMDVLEDLMNCSFPELHKIRYSLFNELFLVRSRLISSVLYPSTRKTIENALLNPMDYFSSERRHGLNTELESDISSGNESIFSLLGDSDSDDSANDKQEHAAPGEQFKKSYQSIEHELKKTQPNAMTKILYDLKKLNEPLISEMFRLYREAPVDINIFDYYESFKSVLDKEKYMIYFYQVTANSKMEHITKDSEVVSNICEFLSKIKKFSGKLKPDEAEELERSLNDKWDAVVFVFFVQFLYDLRYIGVLREGKRKIESWEKAIWKTT